MRKFLIITRSLDRHIDLIESIKSAIETRGGLCEVAVSPDNEDEESVFVPEGTECILTVGGDGTLIGSAQMTFGSGIPLLGVNRGHLGYLCDLNEDTIFDALERLFEDQYSVEERMMLSGHIVDADGRKQPCVQALNDIVISAGQGLNAIQLSVYVDGEYLYSYVCDGMIFSTPTGSTAYNLSANGPIVDPKTSVILLTPINPHTLNSRSIVLDPNAEIEVEVIPRRHKTPESASIAFDGGHKRILHPGEKLVVCRANATTKMIALSQISFLERMSKKLQEN